MNDRRANPHGHSQTSDSCWINAAVVIVGLAIAASAGLLVGRIIYRVFFGGV